MASRVGLRPFHEAQEQQAGHGTVYDTAYAEIQAGRKTSHWIWYIFPQLQALGKSGSSLFYGIRDLNEACDYLRDPILFKRYCAMVSLVLTKLLAGVPINVLMGGALDARKFVSSITLFHTAAGWLTATEKQSPLNFKHLAHLCSMIFPIVAAQHHSRCHQTLADHSVAAAINQLQTAAKAPIAPLPQSSNTSARQTPPPPIIAETIKTLDAYIALRNSEPAYCFQGLFKGYSKKEKLTAAISLLLVLREEVQKNSRLDQIIKRNGLDMNVLRQRDVRQDLKILDQGRLGARLKTLAESNEFGPWYQSKSKHAQTAEKPRTVQGLVEFFLEIRQHIVAAFRSLGL